jgi:hypothetical protein
VRHHEPYVDLGDLGQLPQWVGDPGQTGVQLFPISTPASVAMATRNASVPAKCRYGAAALTLSAGLGDRETGEALLGDRCGSGRARTCGRR